MRDLFAEAVDDSFEQFQRAQRDRLRLGQGRKNPVPAVTFERRVDAAGYGPRRMNRSPASASIACWPKRRSAMPSLRVADACR